jgi:predicted O-methyltransferase YrrM
MDTENKQKLIINYTNTLGYRKSTKDSPAWANSYKVTESLIRKFNVKRMAEIGVARGHHSAHLLEAIDDLVLYVIDPWDLFIDEHYSMWKQNKEEIKKIYENVVTLLKPFGQRSVILKTTSEKAVKKIIEPLDMIFIDADHTYKSVKQDINLWYDKVKEGGIISGHDFNHSHHPGVTLAVKEFFDADDYKINSEIGNVWWVQKKHKEKPREKNKFKKVFKSIKYKFWANKIEITKKVKKNHYYNI